MPFLSINSESCRESETRKLKKETGLRSESGFFLLSVLVIVLAAVLAVTHGMPTVNASLQKKEKIDETREKMLFLTEVLIDYYKNIGEFPPYNLETFIIDGAAEQVYVRTDDVVDKIHDDLGKEDIGSGFDKGDVTLITLFTDYPDKIYTGDDPSFDVRVYYNSKSNMDELVDAYEEATGVPPHVLDALAINPYDNGETPLKFNGWRLQGPYAASAFMPGSYHYDAFYQDIKYIYPFPYDETGYFDYDRNDCTNNPLDLKCNRVLIYSVGANMPFLIDPSQNREILVDYCLMNSFGLTTAELEIPPTGSCDIPMGCPNRPDSCE